MKLTKKKVEIEKKESMEVRECTISEKEFSDLAAKVAVKLAKELKDGLIIPMTAIVTFEFMEAMFHSDDDEKKED